MIAQSRRLFRRSGSGFVQARIDEWTERL